MRGSTDTVPLAAPELSAVMRHSRPLVVAIVVLASAGTGYVGGRIWPLSAFSSPVAPLSVPPSTGSPEPQSTEGGPQLPTLASKSASVRDPIIPFELPSPSQPSTVASLPERAQAEVRGISTSSPDSTAAVLYRAAAGQADADGRGAPQASTSAKDDRGVTTRRRPASARVPRSVSGQGTSAAQSSVVEFAPNPKANQASRDYMSYPSRN
jgi:hypothetical protein